MIATTVVVFHSIDNHDSCNTDISLISKLNQTIFTISVTESYISKYKHLIETYITYSINNVLYLSSERQTSTIYDQTSKVTYLNFFLPLT